MSTTASLTAKPSTEIGAASLLAGYVLGMMSFMASALWIPSAATDFGVPQVTTGILTSLELTVSAIVCLGVAPRLTGYPARLLLMIGAATVILTAGLTALLQLPLIGFGVLRAVEGGAAGLCVAVTSMQASRSANPPKLFGIFQAGQTVGTGIVFAICSPLLPRFGHHAIFGLLAGAAALALLLIGLSSSRATAISAGRPLTQPTLAHGGGMSGALVLACIGVGLVMLVNVGIITTVTAFGANAGLSLQASAKVLAICTVLPIISSGAAVALAGKMPDKLMMAIGAIGTALALLVLALNHSPLGFELGLGFMILMLAFALPSVFGSVSRMDTHGRAAAASQASNMVGLALAPALGTGIVRASSPEAWGLFCAFGVVLGIGMVAAMVPGTKRAAALPLPEAAD